MKQFSKVLALAIALMLVVSGLAMAEPKTYIVGTNPEFAPFEFVGDDGSVQGIDVDIIKAIFTKIDPENKVEILSMSFDGLIPAMISGKIDLAIAGMSVTEDRLKTVSFTDAYFDATQKIIVKTGSDIAGEAGLEGKKIGVQMGTTGDLYVTDNVKGAEVARFDKALDAIQDVISGRLDAVVVDQGPAEAYVKQVGEALTILPDNLSEEVYAIPVKKEDTELLEQMNKALAELKEDGTIQAIIDSYK